MLVKDLSSDEGEILANRRLSEFDGGVIKGILAQKQLVTAKDEQALVSQLECSCNW